MGSKASIVLLKFLQSINIKKQHKYKPYILVINLILKKLISLLMKIVILIFNIIINIIVIENSNEKKLLILGWFN
jgi:type III secretory pathway component EscU